ncbi:hypothetical protein J6590_033270 [Homalodisca vitripennis]|nr:hypothetical protein J6590_033270 [Homalodisca vitripennis]
MVRFATDTDRFVHKQELSWNISTNCDILVHCDYRYRTTECDNRLLAGGARTSTSLAPIDLCYQPLRSEPARQSRHELNKFVNCTFVLFESAPARCAFSNRYV